VRPGSLLGWTVIVSTVALVASPVAVLAWSLVDPSAQVWAELWRTRLPSMIVETVVLLAAVVAGSVALGAGLAWLVAAHDFAGRRVIGWLLVAPLAIPGYVGGFVWLDTLSGVVGARGVRSLWLCALVLVLSLYPYVYLFARAAFADQGADTVAAARSLGTGPFGVFLRVALPAARPAIAAGAALVSMEVLTDIGTVRLFNVSTLADGVMRVWFGTGDAGAASELATALTGAALLLVVVDRLLRSGARRTRGAAEATMPRRRLSRIESAVALAVSVGVLMVALGVPLVRLVGWSVGWGDAPRGQHGRACGQHRHGVHGGGDAARAGSCAARTDCSSDGTRVDGRVCDARSRRGGGCGGGACGRRPAWMAAGWILPRRLDRGPGICTGRALLCGRVPGG
jgi:iron(III) transport system permease protein